MEEIKDYELFPLGSKIIVKKLDALSQTKSGIIISDNAKEKPCQGIVVIVGTGPFKNKFFQKNESKKLDISERQVVALFEKYGGEDIKIGNDDFVILNEESIVGFIKPKE